MEGNSQNRYIACACHGTLSLVIYIHTYSTLILVIQKNRKGARQISGHSNWDVDMLAMKLQSTMEKKKKDKFHAPRGGNQAYGEVHSARDAGEVFCQKIEQRMKNAIQAAATAKVRQNTNSNNTNKWKTLRYGNQKILVLSILIFDFQSSILRTHCRPNYSTRAGTKSTSTTTCWSAPLFTHQHFYTTRFTQHIGRVWVLIAWHSNPQLWSSFHPWSLARIPGRSGSYQFQSRWGWLESHQTTRAKTADI